MPTKIRYNGTEIATVAAGESKILECSGKKMRTNVAVEMPSEYIIPEGTATITENGTFDVTEYASAEVNVEAEDSAVPTEVSTEAEMTALLESGEVGGVYRYTGTSGTYENGAMYVLEEEPDPLVGTWVFNDTVTEPEQGAGLGAFTEPLDTYTVIGSFDGQPLDCNTLASIAMVGIVFDYGSFSFGLDGELGVYTASQLAGKTLVLNENISNERITITDTFRSWLHANATKQ